MPQKTPNGTETLRRLFVYGTLKQTHVQRSVIGRTVHGTPEALPGYRVYYWRFPVALADESSMVHGLLLQVTDEELERLDLYEGPSYIRKQVTLASGKSALVYCGDVAIYGDLLVAENDNNTHGQTSP